MKLAPLAFFKIVFPISTLSGSSCSSKELRGSPNYAWIHWLAEGRARFTNAPCTNHRRLVLPEVLLWLYLKIWSLNYSGSQVPLSGALWDDLRHLLRFWTFLLPRSSWSG